MYYLRPCNVLPGGGVCTATADDGVPLPTLMRMHLQRDGTFVSEPVVSGVEQLKFEYGVSDISGIPAYKKASDVTDWSRVTSVRVSLVAVSPVRDVSVPHAKGYTVGDCTYTIKNGAAPVTTSCPNFKPFGDKPWQFVRTTQSFVVQLRNRLRT
jgi:hypothetical protein